MAPRRLQLYRSNRSEPLVRALSRVLAAPSSTPLRPDLLVVPTHGVERWFRMQLAQRNGVCANLRCVTPLGLLDEAADHSGAAACLWGPERLRWVLYELLDGALDEPLYHTVRAWVLADGVAHRPRRLLDLSRRLAGLFRGYALDRPEMVLGWSATSEDWQARLWAQAQQALGGTNPAQRWAALERACQGEDPLGSLPERICVFTGAGLPPTVLRLLHAIARHRALHLFVRAPSRPHEGASRHPLLASLGRLSHDLGWLLAAPGPGYDQPAGELFVDPQPHSSLAALQSDLLHDQPRPHPPLPARVRVHSCHGPQRQVQVLRQVLLDLLDQSPTLQARDILVLTPDLDRYGPRIEAVFADPIPWGSEHSPGLPIQFVGRGLRSVNPAASALLHGLRLLQTRLDVHDVLDLLASASVRQRFGLTLEAWPQLERWLAEANARWGADAAHRVAEGLPDSELFTWRYALDRLQQDPRDRVRPQPGVEGAERQGGGPLRDALIDFVEGLLALREQLLTAQALSAWRRPLLALLAHLTVATSPQTQAVREALRELFAEAAEVGGDPTLPLAAVCNLVEGRLSLPLPRRGEVSGGITVCDLSALSGVPYKVICLLGMDGQAFPRVGTRLAIDRVAAEPRLGDRSPREDDRTHFLEALLAAREQLEVFCSGRGVRDNRPRAFAAPVSELIEALERLQPGTVVVQQHPLQPFSPEVFALAPGEQPLSFDLRGFEAATALVRGRVRPAPPRPLLSRTLPASTQRTLHLGTLVRFLQHPPKWYCQQVLGLWLPTAGVGLPRREPGPRLSGLEAWSLRDVLLSALMSGHDLDRLHQRWRRAGSLPLGTPGELAWATLLAEAQAIACAARAALDASPHCHQIELELDGMRLSGQVAGCTSTVHISWQAGALRDAQRLELWLHHLALCAAGHSVRSLRLAYDSRLCLAPLSADHARQQLGELSRLFWAGQRVPLMFFPSTARGALRAYTQARYQRQRAADKAARRAWARYDEPGPYGRWLLGNLNPYVDRCPLPVVEALHAQVLADRVWAPFERQVLP